MAPPHCPKSNPNFPDITRNVEETTQCYTRNISLSISFSAIHFVFYLGKSITFRTVQSAAIGQPVAPLSVEVKSPPIDRRIAWTLRGADG